MACAAALGASIALPAVVPVAAPVVLAAYLMLGILARVRYGRLPTRDREFDGDTVLFLSVPAWLVSTLAASIVLVLLGDSIGDVAIGALVTIAAGFVHTIQLVPFWGGELVHGLTRSLGEQAAIALFYLVAPTALSSATIFTLRIL